jgi:acyl-CoA synthetase (AMP-forming)/AMP-acid ligase II
MSDWTEIGRVYLETTGSAAPGVDEVRAWCAARLARFKVPREIVFVPALPRTGSGKVDRAALERMIAAESATAP